MYDDRTHNWDYDPASTDPDSGKVEADHETAREFGGHEASRLLHRTCNRSRGNGQRDHLRPALIAAKGGHAGNILTWT